jgi:predicted amidohydrolase YtcJ
MHESRVLSGYIDAHIHVLGAARVASTVDVSDVNSVEELLEQIARAPGDGWIRAWGYDDFRTSRHPEPSELLRASNGRPVRLVHRTGHYTVVTHSGRPPRPLPELILAQAATYLAEIRSHGIAGVVDASGHDDEESIEIIRTAASQAGVSVAVLVAPSLIATTQTGVKVRRFPTNWRDLLPLAKECRKRGLLLALHVVEAEEIEAVIELAEASKASIRVEHVGMLFAGQAERMATAKVEAVVQPSLIRIRGDSYLARLPGALWPHLHPIRTLLSAGVRVAFSSDAPVTPSDPQQWIASAVERRTDDGHEVAPDEAIGLATAEGLARDSMAVSRLQF